MGLWGWLGDVQVSVWYYGTLMQVPVRQGIVLILCLYEMSHDRVLYKQRILL